jgi:hypothetical protein
MYTASLPQREATPAIPLAAFDRALSTLSTGRHFTPAEKADALGDLICWEDAGQDKSGRPILLAHSPISGHAHRLAYEASEGRYACSCEGAKKATGGRCYHLISFERAWLPKLREVVAELVARDRRRPGAAEMAQRRQAEWD